jgi:hypothetical protein
MSESLATVAPVSKKEYMTAYRRNGFGAGARAHVFLGVCPMCRKTVGGSGKCVYLNADMTKILTQDEANALPIEEVRRTYVGAACFKKLGDAYKITKDHPGTVRGEWGSPDNKFVKADHDLCDYVR